MLVPIGPAQESYNISLEDARDLLKKSGALLVRGTQGFVEKDVVSDTDWYAVICDRFHDLGQLGAKNRSEVKRGLKNCRVEKVEADEIAEKGFDVFVCAFDRYSGVKKPSLTRGQFKDRTLKTKDFSDIIDYWGVYFEDRMIGYSQNFLYDRVEVNYSTMKFHPDFLKFYPSYALFFEMNKYYLRDNRFEYVNDGFRSVLHETNIQQFLIDKFSFRRVCTPLIVHYRPDVEIFLRFTSPFKSLLSPLNSKLAALYVLDEAAGQVKA
jgi:hypothetical protein